MKKTKFIKFGGLNQGEMKENSKSILKSNFKIITEKKKTIKSYKSE